MIAPHQQNNVLILRAIHDYAWNHQKNCHLPSQATKIHTRGADGKWTTEGYNIDSAASATAYSVSNLREFMDVLVKTTRDHRCYLVGDVVAPGQDPKALRRAIHLKGKDEAPGLTAHPHGHQWFCCEVDKVTNPPAWFDPHSKDRSRDADFVRWWIDTHMPPQFHGRSAVLQWSASGLVGGKISMHIWMWLNRPVARDCIRAYYKTRTEWKAVFDTCIWGGARVHYIADPKFKHPDGTYMDDPLAGHRWLWVDGPMGDEVEALPEWVDRPTWAARLAQEAAERTARRAAHKNRKQAAIAVAVVSGAIIEAKQKAKGKPSKYWTPEQQVAAQDEAAAQTVLDACAEQIRNLTNNDGKHEALLAITLRAARCCFDVLDEEDVRAALEDDAVDALMAHERPRPQAVAVNEFRSLLRGAWAMAASEGAQGGAKVADFAGIGAALCPAPAIPLSPPNTSPISLSAETADLVSDLDIEAENFGIQFIDTRAELAHLIADAIAEGGRHAFCGPAGLGKSHAICESLIEHRRRRRLTPASPVHIAVPDLGLAAEMRDDLRRRGANAVLAVTRTERNCEKFAEFVLAGRLAPNGGKTLCERCDWHPKRAGSADACPFWSAYSQQANADFICESHALEALKGSLDLSQKTDPILSVRIDWASFGELDPGDTAVPWVRRTAEGLRVSARVCYRVGEGTEPPLPCYDDTPRWTSAAKGALIEWLAAAYKCDPNRAAVVEAATGGRAVQAFVDWTAIGKLAGSSALYRPCTRFETQGWLKGWHIGVERADASAGGQPLPKIEFTGTHPLTSESKAEIRAWIRGAWGVATDFDLDEHARAHIDEWPVDALVIDESILHSLRFGGALTRGQLTDLRLAGEIAGPGVEDLLRLMWRSEENKAARDKAKPHYFPSNTIAEAVGEVVVISRHESGAARLSEALRLDDGEQRLQHLAGGWGWEAVEALRSCLDSGWAGAHIEGGLLHVAAPRRLALGDVRATILLDATMTPIQACATLGEGVKVEILKTPQNPYLEVIHIPVDLGPRAGAWGDADGPRTQRNAAHLLSALERWGGPNTVSFLHKKALDPERCWVADLVADGRFGAMTYHGAAQSRGSNKYRGFETNIMTGCHVPRSAKRQQAELLAVACGRRYGDGTAKWDDEAAWLLEGGAQAQELARIRPLDATKEKPKRLVFLDTRSPEWFGLRTTETINPDLFAWEVLASLPPLGGDYERSKWYSAVMAAVAQEVIGLAGGVFPMEDGKTWTVPSPSRLLALLNDMTASLLPRQNKETDTTTDTLSSRLNTWLRQRFAGDWEAFAQALNIRVAEVHLSGRHPLHVLHTTPTPDLATLEAHLAQLGHHHYRLSPKNPWTHIGGLDDRDPLYRALWPLQRVDFEGQALGTLYKTLAATAEVSPRTVQRWVEDRRLEGEDNRACLVRLWAIVRADCERQHREELERRAVEAHGVAPAEAPAVISEIYRTLGCAPWQIKELAATITAEGEAEQGVCGS